MSCLQGIRHCGIVCLKGLATASSHIEHILLRSRCLSKICICCMTLLCNTPESLLHVCIDAYRKRHCTLAVVSQIKGKAPNHNRHALFEVTVQYVVGLSEWCQCTQTMDMSVYKACQQMQACDCGQAGTC